MHVLLIEDDLDLGRALQAALQLEGFSCEWLRRVQDAPLTLQDGNAACVLLDLSLPDGSGFELLARWRRPERERTEYFFARALMGRDVARPVVVIREST